MPILSLTTSVDIDDSKREIIAKCLSDLTHRIFHKDKSVTVVNIITHHGSWFGVNGSILDAVYQLSISITAESNTTEEIELWQKETWGYLKNKLAVPDDAICYTSVNNIDGNNWGFNGISQYARKQLKLRGI